MNQNSNGTVITEREGNNLNIEIDRQDKMNGFTPEMFKGAFFLCSFTNFDQCLFIL